MSKNINVISIPTKLDINFFLYWVEFLRPIHNLTSKEIQVAAALLYERYKLSQVILEESILDKILLSEDVRNRVSDSCGIRKTHFQNILKSLRVVKFVENDCINRKYIPRFEVDAKEIKLILFFEICD